MELAPELDEVQRFILDQLRAAGKPQAVEALAWHWHNRVARRRERPPSRAARNGVRRAVEGLVEAGLIRAGLVDVVRSSKEQRTVCQQLACWLRAEEPPELGG